MFNARRAYAYLVSAISLATVLYAIIWLLRDLFVPDLESLTTQKSLNIAILIIGVPVYLGHWLWQQRLAATSIEERGALGRRIYLYVVMAAMVAVIAFQGYALASVLLGVKPPVGYPEAYTVRPSLYYLLPIVLAALTFAFHFMLLRGETFEEPDAGSAATARRLYLYGFAAAGMTMLHLGIVQLIRWLFSQIGVWAFDAAPLDVIIRPEIARVLIGLPLWWIYWQWAQRLFQLNSEERESVLRKFYLYAAVFIGMVGMVSSAATILAEYFHQWLGLRPEGYLQNSFTQIIAFAALWAFHSLILRRDLRITEDTAQQAEMRRLYLYILAAVGLIALIGGVISNISLLISTADTMMTTADKVRLAYSSAALLAGLPVWFFAWRQAQQEAGRGDAIGGQARRSSIRKGYIYFFQFVAIMAVLGSAIYVVSEFVTSLLSERSIKLDDIALPIGISVVHSLVWLFHWATLRADRQLSVSDEIRQIEEMRLVVLQRSGDHAASAVHNRLQKISPTIKLEPLYLQGNPASEPDGWFPLLLQRIAGAQTIVVPWTMLVPQSKEGEAAHQLAQAVVASPARKVVLQDALPDWVWIGSEPLEEDKVVQKAVEALRQLANGEKIRGGRKLGCVAITLIILGVLFLLTLVSVTYFLIPFLTGSY